MMNAFPAYGTRRQVNTEGWRLESCSRLSSALRACLASLDLPGDESPGHVHSLTLLLSLDNFCPVLGLPPRVNAIGIVHEMLMCHLWVMNVHIEVVAWNTE